MQTKYVPFHATILGCLLLLSACSGGGSGGPVQGSPEWLWLAAQENFAAADYVKTQEHLDKLADTESEWQKRAAVWRIVVLSGLSRAYRELSDIYSKGAETNNAQSSRFQNGIQQNQRDSRQYAIDLAESLPKYQKLFSDDADILLDFAFPSGNPNDSPLALRLEGGEVLNEDQQANATQQVVERGVILQAVLLAGEGEDVNAARAKFEAGAVEVPRQSFMNALGRTMWIVSELFDRTHLNLPDIEKILVMQAMKSIEPALESDDEDLKTEAEELKEEIEEKQKLEEQIRRRLRG